MVKVDIMGSLFDNFKYEPGGIHRLPQRRTTRNLPRPVSYTTDTPICGIIYVDKAIGEEKCLQHLREP